MKQLESLPLASLLLVALAGSSAAQGRFRNDLNNYLNFEAPVVSPVTIATVADGTSTRKYLLIANTPDNSVRVYDLEDLEADRPEFELRIPVGLEPVSVAFASFDVEGNRFDMLYTADWLSDTVTIVRLASSAGTLSYQMFGSFPVTDVPLTTAGAGGLVDPPEEIRNGDEPVHVLPVELPGLTTEDPPRRYLFVAKRTASSISVLDALTGMPADGLEENMDILLTDAGALNRNVAATGQQALKEPHVIARRNSDPPEIWVLGQQGGGSADSPNGNPGGPTPQDNENLPYDVDLWRAEVTVAGSSPGFLSFQAADIFGELGTTNFNMKFMHGHLFVLSTVADNDEEGNPELRGRETGFSRTMLFRINPSGPSVVGTRDLNRGSNGAAVDPGDAIVQATDLAAFTTGLKKYVCFVGFGSDQFGMIDVSNSAPSLATAPIHRFRLYSAANESDNEDVLLAPRGLAVDNAAKRAYILNSNGYSVYVLDLDKVRTGTGDPLAAEFSLDSDGPGTDDRDPVPAYIRTGRRLLYSAKVGNGFNSCASCHIDGRSDQLTWRLSTEDVAAFTETPAGDPLPETLFNGSTVHRAFEFQEENIPAASFITGIVPPWREDDDENPDPYDNFAEFREELRVDGFPHNDTVDFNAKGPMMTQSLQGLANYEIEAPPEEEEESIHLAHYMTNAPYHWRGDKRTFLDFKEAFRGLLGRSVEIPDISDEEMEQFEEFINSVHYPPNPLQRLDRTYSGSLGDPDELGSFGDPPVLQGEGAQSGLKLFHIQRVSTFGMLSCSHCHTLPSGSNNRWSTASLGFSHDSPDFLDDSERLQPLNTPALRGMRQKEARLELGDGLSDDVIGIRSPRLQTGEFGMGHDGRRFESLNGFLREVSLALNNSGVDIAGDASAQPRLERLIQFTREFDHGVAPAIGRTLVIAREDINTSSGALTNASKNVLLNAMEDEVRRGNTSLALHVFNGDAQVGIASGWWYRPSDEKYVLEHAQINSAKLRDALLKLCFTSDFDRVVIFSAPLGSEHRIASTTGVAQAQFPAPSPLAINLIGAVPNTANAVMYDGSGAPMLTANSEILFDDTVFPPPLSIEAFEGMRSKLFPPPGPARGHEAPRRLQFTGTGIAPVGGIVKLGICVSGAKPTAPNPVFEELILPIYPTGKTIGESMIYETAVELDPLFYYMLLGGGPAAGHVNDAMSGTFTSWPELTELADWNLYRIIYVHPDGPTESNAALQPMPTSFVP